MLFGLPEHIVIADGDGRERQFILEFHIDINVFRICDEKGQFNEDEDHEQNDKTDNYQQPQKPVTTTANNKYKKSNKADKPARQLCVSLQHSQWQLLPKIIVIIVIINVADRASSSVYF